ncbi:MAG: hypothetical protein R3B11_01530 [Nitrospira sp.]|jgi:uncharacterized coiled-coil protein SlyX|nr:hypothetical protein [Nitrospira sp.]MCW5786696.1 hypothetical protein [Nitrospira sp.]MDR4474676.1 hypothetical protein [Nitrospira sp.]HAP41998.1 hypothetical protein [Nitrospira sp.]
MNRKQQRLAEKPVHLLTLAPDKGEKGAVNPFAPSPLRAAIGKVFVKLEDMTERFEDWCQYGSSEDRTEQPLGQRVSKWLGAPVARHIEHEVQAEHGLVPARRWDGAVGDLIFRLRDRAGFVQRALAAQARELKDWVIHHTQSTQAELHELREQVSTQKAQMEELSSQLQDLRALVSSQQQVLMYMGKDMEMAPPAELELSLVPPRPLPYRDREMKSSRDRREASAEASETPYLNA